jgi:hypothetical protein
LEGVDYESRLALHESDLEFAADVLAPIINSHDAVSDVPVCGIYDVLLRRYPSARFIALRRDPHDWIKSIRRHVGGRNFDPYERCVYWRYLDDRPESLGAVEDDRLVAMFETHYAALERTFAGIEHFLCADIRDARVGEAICRFVGAPPRPFPHVDYLKVDEAPGLARAEAP